MKKQIILNNEEYNKYNNLLNNYEKEVENKVKEQIKIKWFNFYSTSIIFGGLLGVTISALIFFLFIAPIY